MGVKDSEKLQNELTSQARTTLNEPVRPFVERLNGKTVVVREVKDAEPNRKPIFIQRRGLSKGAFRRVADRLCSNEDLEELLALRKGEIHEVSEVHDSEFSESGA